MAKSYLDRLECPHVLVIPGNHDSRNVGYVHFEELFGPRGVVLHTGDDLDRGRRLDRARPRLRHDRPLALRLARGAVRRAGALSHLHAAPPPAADPRHRPRAQHGLRRRRHARGAAALQRQPRARRATSTCPTPGASRTCSWSTPAPCCTLRLRGDTRPCYNIVTIDDDHVRVERKYPFHGTRDDHRVLALDAALPEVRRPARRAAARTNADGDRRGGVDSGKAARASAAPAARPAAVALIDGEHYPPVVVDAAARAAARYELRRGALSGRRREAARRRRPLRARRALRPAASRRCPPPTRGAAAASCARRFEACSASTRRARSSLTCPTSRC